MSIYRKPIILVAQWRTNIREGGIYVPITPKEI
jgi:hypothetical protein